MQPAHMQRRHHALHAAGATALASDATIHSYRASSLCNLGILSLIAGVASLCSLLSAMQLRLPSTHFSPAAASHPLLSVAQLETRAQVNNSHNELKQA